MFLHNIASTHLHLGDYKKALELQQKVYKPLKKALGYTHPTFMQCLSTLAYCYAKTGDLKTAHTLYKELYPLQLAAYGEEHPKTKKTLKRIKSLQAKL